MDTFSDVLPLASRHSLFSILAILFLPLALLYLTWSLVLYPLLFSPLRHIPAAHPLAPLSPLWIDYIRHQWRENRTILKAHGRLGPVIRLGPNEVSVNCVDNGLRTIYPGAFEKPDWYPNLFANYSGVQNMFSTKESGPHSARKRMLSHVYAKSYLQSSPNMAFVIQNVIYGRLLPLLQVKERMGLPVNIRRTLESTTMDLVTGYLFGFQNASNFLTETEEADGWLTKYQSRRDYSFWPQEMPRLTKFFSAIGIHLYPTWISEANRDLEAWCLRHCDDAENTLLQSEKASAGASAADDDYPVVYAQLRSQMQKVSHKPFVNSVSTAPQRLQIASEMLDHLSAGHETSAVTLTFLFYELSLRPSLQKRLRAELKGLTAPISLPTTSKESLDLPSSKSIDALPLLHCIVMETLRRYAAVPSPQPRETPQPKTPSDTRLGAYIRIPGGVRVSCSAYCLHRNEAVYPDPEAWIPERWLNRFEYSSLVEHGASEEDNHENREAEEQRLREMHRWFWAFGSGGRMCIGSNLAMQQMKWIVAAVMSCFKVELVGLDDADVNVYAYEDVWQDDLEVDEAKQKSLIDEAPVLEQQDTFAGQPLAMEVKMRLARW